MRGDSSALGMRLGAVVVMPPAYPPRAMPTPALACLAFLAQRQAVETIALHAEPERYQPQTAQDAHHGKVFPRRY